MAKQIVKTDEQIRAIIQILKQSYEGEGWNAFQFTASTYIGGDHNKLLRQEIIKLTAGEIKSLRECGYHATLNALKAHFQQPQLF